MRSRFQQVDVFSSRPYFGNPVAVVLDAEGLDDEQMQRIAAWTNLSETTFVREPSQPSADYAVRIFTPTQEVPFAGHPTLGTCHAWLAAGGQPRENDLIVHECLSGLLDLRRIDGRLAFSEPPLLRSGAVDEALVVHIAAALGIARNEIVDAEWVDNGPGWVGVRLETADAVLALRPGFVDIDLAVVGAHPAGSAQAVEVRAFFPQAGSTVEDPVTGSLGASLTPWLIRTGVVTPPYVIGQGATLGREGRVHVSIDAAGTVWVGGDTITCVEGEIEL